MSVSEVDICNMALGELGEGHITNLETDTSAKAVQCRIYYEPTVVEVLASHDWNCAIWYQALALVAEADDDYLLDDYDTYAYQFQLPTDPLCLRVWSIPKYPKAPYEVVSGYLLTNISAVTIKYIWHVTDTTKYSPLLVKAIAYRLAAELAPHITNNPQDQARMFVLYDLQLNRAVDIDGQERENPQVEEYAIRDAKNA